MNKEGYLNELAQYLKLLPPEEFTDIMAEFREHFEFAKLSGRSEAEVISKLGNPRLVAREVLTQSQIEKADKSPTLLSVTRAVMATVSLGLFNLIIVMLPFVASLAIIAGVFGFAIFLIISPILFIIQNQSVTFLFNDIFLMLVLVGGGILIVIGALKFTRIYYNLVIRYLKYNLKVIKKDVTYIEK
ncbi:HAAS signaling domain-containing protein [Paenibacillus sp. Z3-2]